MTTLQSTSTTESAKVPVEEYGYPVGHLGHLTETQEEALEAFRKLCNGAEESTGESAISIRDDVTLLRFLRARRFHPEEAFQQLSDTEKWRRANDIDHLYANIDIADFEETKKLYPQWTGRRDKRGVPTFVFEVQSLNAKTMAAYAKSAEKTSMTSSKGTAGKSASTVSPRMLRILALYENMIQFGLPLCSKLQDRPHAGTPISQSINIVDISNVGLRQFWNLRSHMQDASILATAHYPETLDRIFVLGAPSFFPTIWTWIKRWFDPITTSKIFIVPEHDTFKILSTYIDPANIPKSYGGQLDYTYGGPPVLDPAIEERIIWHKQLDAGMTWPEGSLKWLPGTEPGSLQIFAMGSAGGTERREVLATFYPDGKPGSEKQGTTPVVSEPAATLSATAATEIAQEASKVITPPSKSDVNAELTPALLIEEKGAGVTPLEQPKPEDAVLANGVATIALA